MGKIARDLLVGALNCMWVEVASGLWVGIAIVSCDGAEAYGC